MRVIYARQKFPTSCRKTLFLAGPSPRGDKVTGLSNVPTWRTEAIRLLRENDFAGDVYVPEPEDGKWSMEDYDEQFDWENEGLERADCILFWVPRDLKTLPGFTTNHEHGEYFRFGKTVLGAPSFRGTPKMRYLVRKGELVGQAQAESLGECIDLALAHIGDGAFRHAGETMIPLHIWRTSSFQKWYRALLDQGSRLDRATVEWSSGKRATMESHYYWVLNADIYVAAFGRVVKNQLIRSM